MDGGKILQLRDVAEMVRKSDDSKQVIKGLSLISNLIESNPDELVNHTCKILPLYCIESKIFAAVLTTFFHAIRFHCRRKPNESELVFICYPKYKIVVQIPNM